MIPFLFINVPVSSMELYKPKIELVSCFTTIENTNNEFIANISRFQGEDLNVCNYLNFIGTTIISTPKIKFVQSNELPTDFYSGDYDITVKMPKTMILSKKVKIRSVSTFKPKVIL